MSDGGVATDILRDHLESHSQRCVLVEPALNGGGFERLTPDSYRLDPAQPEHFRQLLEDAFTDDRPPCRGVVHLWDLLAAPPADTSPESLESATTLGPVSVRASGASAGAGRLVGVAAAVAGDAAEHG